MRKILVMALSVILVLSVVVVPASAITFSDITERHWAYKDVQTLVADGTVAGYVDGTFRPNGTVTRAEFVKMLGAGSELRKENYSDVAETHWAYTYIMKSGFPEDGSNMFKPDLAITRGLVAELLWNRNGQPNDAYAPSIITSQYSANTQAAAWAYESGLMLGDDGINLRFNDTLSRAEAAVLIVRARNPKPDKTVFANAVSPKILENVHNGLNLFYANGTTKLYAPNDTITNGEMARAALRIGCEETNLLYAGLIGNRADFEHTYARDLSIICDRLGMEKNLTLEYADKAANFGDTVATLTYHFISISKNGVVYGSKTDGLPDSISDMMNICLTFAKDKGIITLKEDLSAPITLREFTAVCLMLDNLIGSQSDITTQINPYTGKSVAQNHSLLYTEIPYGDFQVMLENMPNIVYSKAPLTQTKKPTNSYNFAREYSSVFIGFLQSLKEIVWERSGANVEFIYYPSLLWENGNGYTLRVACQITNMADAKTVKQLFATQDNIEGGEISLKNGTLLYLDIATGQEVKTPYLTAEKADIEQIIAIAQ